MIPLDAAGMVLAGLQQVCTAAIFGLIFVRVFRYFFQDVEGVSSKASTESIITSGVFIIGEACKLLCMVIYRAFCMDPFLLLNPRNWIKACRFSLRTGRIVARAQLLCFCWSAGVVYKGASGQLTTSDYLENDFPIGVTPEWAQEDNEKHRYVLKTYNTKFQLLRAIPLRTLSRLMGRLMHIELPVLIRTRIYQAFARLYHAKPEECTETDLSVFPSVGHFFRRRIQSELRPVSYKHDLTSPADGTVLFYNKVENGVLEQVKGVTYSLQGFLGPSPGMMGHHKGTSPCDDSEYQTRLVTQPGNSLYQCIIYLAPGDYHHFHSPADWSPTSRRHFPGELFSVNPSFARWVQGLFNMNERAIYSGRWRYGFFSMTAVGATNVGSIHVNCDPTLTTNIEDEFEAGVFYDKSLEQPTKKLRLRKGQEMGDFSFGSTVVLLFEAPKSFHFNIQPGQKVQYGQPIGSVKRRRCSSAARH